MAPPKELIDEITKGLVDRGKLIEAGWIGLRLVAVPESTPEGQVAEMRTAFFAGAQHLWGSIMTVLEPDAEPTENDLRRMDQINAELHEFVAAFKRQHGL